MNYNFVNNNSGKALRDLVDSLRGVSIHGQPIDREISSDGTQIILSND